MSDWIALVEAAYCLEHDLTSWLTRLAERAAPIFDDGLGITALAFRVGPQGVRVEGLVAHGGPPELAAFALQTNQEASARAVDRVYRSPQAVATLSEVLADRPADLDLMRSASGGRFEDALGMVAHVGGGRGVALNTPLARARTMSDAERARWQRAALHVAAGHRLRLALDSTAFEDPSVEAVLDPDGRVHDAQPAAASRTARDVLRNAVLRSERARGPAWRRDADSALALWEALVRGRWSLIDHFDTDGRRFVVAHRNELIGEDPRGLTPRERDVAELLGRGHAPKEIAYALGLPRSTVENAIARARAKLAIDSIAQLALFFSPGGMRARLSELEVAGEALLAGSTGFLDPHFLVSLTDAERAVVVLLLQGATNRAIAASRGSAERTIANQVQAIYRKLGVGSRTELAVALRR